MKKNKLFVFNLINFVFKFKSVLLAVLLMHQFLACDYTPTGEFLNGDYTIKARHSNKCLTASSSRWDLYQTDCDIFNKDQIWTIESTGNKQYFIRAKQLGQCMDGENFGNINGTPVIKFPCRNYNNDNQKFTITNLKNGFYQIKIVYNGRSVTVPDLSLANDAGIKLWDDQQLNSQQWFIFPAPLDPGDSDTE